jgi:tetratricopeptide (TPR) repeat protein
MRKRAAFLGFMPPARSKVTVHDPACGGAGQGAHMLPYAKAALHRLSYPLRWARRRPWTALLLAVLLLLIGAAAGGYWYICRQWHQAQTLLVSDPAAARERLAVCLWFWPRDLDVHLLAARAARLSGDVRDAELHLNRCLKLHGSATERVQLEFLLLRVQTGDIDDVFHTLNDAVERGHPETPVILETVGFACMQRFRYKTALACFSRWIELYPETAKAYQWRGWVLERLSHYKLANEDYRKALELDPDLIPVRLRVAEIFLEDKQAPEALPHLERLYRQAPERADVRARLGMCRFLQGQTDEARRLLESAVPKLPNDPALLVYLAKLDIQDGRGPEAEARLRKVLKADPSDAEARYNLGAALRLQRRTDEAAEAMKDYEIYKERLDRLNTLLKEVIDTPSARVADYVEVGELLIGIGRERVGVYWLEQALERDPGHVAAHEAMAKYYEKRGDEEKAAVHRRFLREPKAKAAG